jgi:SAM-dependent methyltransferase
MLKITKKIQFSSDENKMNSIANTKIARDLYYSAKGQNVKFLLEKRFSWMNEFINDDDIGIEVGSGAGFTKDFIKNKNFKLTDLGNDEHLDYKNIDAQNTGFKDGSFDYVIASNMIHHIPFPMKFFREMNRILKKKRKINHF